MTGVRLLDPSSNTQLIRLHGVDSLNDEQVDAECIQRGMFLECPQQRRVDLSFWLKVGPPHLNVCTSMSLSGPAPHCTGVLLLFFFLSPPFLVVPNNQDHGVRGNGSHATAPPVDGTANSLPQQECQVPGRVVGLIALRPWGDGAPAWRSLWVLLHGCAISCASVEGGSCPLQNKRKIVWGKWGTTVSDVGIKCFLPMSCADVEISRSHDGSDACDGLPVHFPLPFLQPNPTREKYSCTKVGGLQPLSHMG